MWGRSLNLFNLTANLNSVLPLATPLPTYLLEFTPDYARHMHILVQVQILSPCFAYSTFRPFFLELTKNESHSKREILNSSTKAKAHKKR